MRRQRDGQGDPRAKKRAQESAERLTFYASMSARTDDAIGGFSRAATDIKREVEGHLSKHGLDCPALRLETIEE